jgi:phosphatidylinositol glycan class B
VCPALSLTKPYISSRPRSLALASLTLLDSFYYQRLVITPLSFVLANASPVSLFYGSAPWHYYLTQALPLLCGFAFPFALLGMRLVWKERNSNGLTALAFVGWSLFIYSCAGHKEWRFLHPILPLFHIFAAKYLVDAYHSRTTKLHSSPRHRLPILHSHILILCFALPLIVYTTLFHSHAQVSVLRYLHALPSSDLRSVGFLTPCHSTPGQSHLHRRDLDFWALGCEPPLGLRGTALAAYRDQTDVFYASPRAYLDAYFPHAVDTHFPRARMSSTPPGRVRDWRAGWAHVWPSHLVLFGALLEEEGVREKLEGLGYVQVWAAGNGLEEDSRRRGGVRVWKFIGEEGG